MKADSSKFPIVSEMQSNVCFSDAKHEAPDAWKRSSLDFWARGFFLMNLLNNKMTSWWRQQRSHTSWVLGDSASNFLSLRQETKHFQRHFPWHFLWRLTQKRNGNFTILTRDFLRQAIDSVQVQPRSQGPLSSSRRERTLGTRLVPSLPRVLCLWPEQRVAWHRTVNARIPGSRTYWNSKKTWMSNLRNKSHVRKWHTAWLERDFRETTSFTSNVWSVISNLRNPSHARKWRDAWVARDARKTTWFTSNLWRRFYFLETKRRILAS